MTAQPVPPGGGSPGASRLRPGIEARILDLIGAVYDAALDETLWPGLAPRIAHTFDSASAQIQVRHLEAGRVERLALTDNYKGHDLQAYESYYAARDVWVARAAALGMSGVVASKDLISDAEFERTEIYRDWARSLGIFYVLGAVFRISDDRLGVLGIHRPRAGGGYDDEAKARASRFLPHLKRALEIRQRLAGPAIARAVALDALERSGTATLVASGDGRLLYANRRAEELLRTGDVVLVVVGRLTARDHEAAARLSALIRTSAATAGGVGSSSGGALSIARGERLPLTVLVAPFRPARDGFGAPLPAAIVFLRDPESPNPRNLALQGLFGLTAAEATLAAGLADGKGVEGLAMQLGISLNTARTHLKNIFAKTGTNRHAQLVALILGSVAVLMQR